MNFKLFENYKENKNNTPLFETEDSFVLLSEKNIKQISESFRKGGLSIFIDENQYDKTISVTKINIKDVGALYFVFPNANDKEEIIKTISSLKEMPVETLEEKENKVKAVIDNIKSFNPLMVISDTYFSFINEKTFDKNIIVLMKKDDNAPEVKEGNYHIKEDNKGNINKTKKRLLLNIFYVALIPALLIAFIFMGIGFFTKDNVGAGIFLIIVALGVSVMLGHGLYLINKDKEYRNPFNKYKLTLYAVNLGGLLIGALFSFLLGISILEFGSKTHVLSLTLIAILIALIICVILHFGMLYFREYREKKKENK